MALPMDIPIIKLLGRSLDCSSLGLPIAELETSLAERTKDRECFEHLSRANDAKHLSPPRRGCNEVLIATVRQTVGLVALFSNRMRTTPKESNLSSPG